MSNGSTGSTSSTQKGDSPPWTDLSKLGEYILAQLGGEKEERDLLVRWVAHRLAEYMSQAETAGDARQREAARDAAAPLIAQLWAARGGWPRGWPPDPVREFTEGIREAQSTPFSGPPEDPGRLPPWLSTLGALAALAREEQAVWLNGALLELGAAELHSALEVAPDSDAEPDDMREMRLQLRYHDDAAQWVAEQAQDGEDPAKRADRAHIFERALTDIAQRRAALVELTVKDVRRGQRRKPLVGGALPPRRRPSRRRARGG